MKVQEVLQRLDEGEKMKQIAESVDLNPSTVQRKLKKLGYEWDNSAKVWNWKGQGDQPLEQDLSELVRPKKDNKKAQPKKEHNNVVEMQSTHDQVNHAAANDNVDVFDRILNTKKKDHQKLQRGIYFDPAVAEALDKAFNNKSKGAKSEFVNEAVKQVLKAKNLL